MLMLQKETMCILVAELWVILNQKSYGFIMSKFSKTELFRFCRFYFFKIAASTNSHN